MDLFEASDTGAEGHKPLAELMRPKEFSGFLGHEAVVGVQTPLMRSVKETGRLPNLILWGPPGTGKTTFALLLSSLVESEFISVNAVDTGAKKLREIGQAARERRMLFQKSTVLFVDEIHRFNKAQQDVLLPFTERGDLSLVGATTENPSYELNSALLSRSRVLVFEKHKERDLRVLLDAAFEKKSLDKKEILIEKSENAVLSLADGDARRLLNVLELIFDSYENAKAELTWPLDVSSLEKVAQGTPLYYDKSADEHYDTISAFIKSVRGSDANAAIYYLARMLKGGEDPVFIARRLVILASEDIGNADPRGLNVAVSGLQAVELVGMPEAGINLAQVTTYLASAPKSNRSYMAYRKALGLVDKKGQLPIPKSLRSSKTKLAKEIGYGVDYKYSHDGPLGWLEQDFLPEEIKDESLYEPTDRGFEKNIREYQAWVKQTQKKD